MFLAENEVIWILNCICSACWERKSSCETQSRSEPDCRTHHGHSSETTFVLLWGHLSSQFKDKSTFLLASATPLALCKLRALGGQRESLIPPQHGTQLLVRHFWALFTSTCLPLQSGKGTSLTHLGQKLCNKHNIPYLQFSLNHHLKESGYLQTASTFS